MPSESVAPIEIDAYLDGELDLDRRLAVEDHLIRSPAAAARALADMRSGTALRLMAEAPLPEPPEALRVATDRLVAALARQAKPEVAKGVRWWFPFRRAAAAVAVASVFGGIVMISPPWRQASARPPAYVDEAVNAFQTGLLRRAMVSQPESRVFDAQDIQQSTRIRVPALPPGWRVTDVQIFPSVDGPALQIMAQTEPHGEISIFAVRSSAPAPARPVALRHDGTSVAYWRHGDIAYALAGTDSPRALDLAAEDLADNRLD